MNSDLVFYGGILAEIKTRIRQAQTRAALSANAEMIAMYWDIGRMLHQRQQEKGWGTGVIPRLAADLKNELPEQKGFSERNLKYMIRFAREYGTDQILSQAAAKSIVQRNAALSQLAGGPSDVIVQQPAAQLALPLPIILGLPWFHHVVLIEKVKDLPARRWYARQALEQFVGCGEARTALIEFPKQSTTLGTYG